MKINNLIKNIPLFSVLLLSFLLLFSTSVEAAGTYGGTEQSIKVKYTNNGKISGNPSSNCTVADFTVEINDIQHEAFCGNHNKVAADSSNSLKVYKVDSSCTNYKLIKKILYYGYGGPGDKGYGYKNSTTIKARKARTSFAISCANGYTDFENIAGTDNVFKDLSYNDIPNSFTVYYLDAGSNAQPVYFWDMTWDVNLKNLNPDDNNDTGSDDNQTQTYSRFSSTAVKALDNTNCNNFIGWENQSKKNFTVSGKDTSGNKTYKAQWEKRSHYVFITHEYYKGNTLITSVEDDKYNEANKKNTLIKCGSSFIPPTKTNYNGRSYNVVSGSETRKITERTEITIKYQLKQYNIKYYAGNILLHSTTKWDGDSITLYSPSVGSNSDFHYSNTWTHNEGTIYHFGGSYSRNMDTTFVTQKIKHKSTIVINADGGTINGSFSKDSNGRYVYTGEAGSFTLSLLPTREGYRYDIETVKISDSKGGTINGQLKDNVWYFGNTDGTTTYITYKATAVYNITYADRGLSYPNNINNNPTNYYDKQKTNGEYYINIPSFPTTCLYWYTQDSAGVTYRIYPEGTTNFVLANTDIKGPTDVDLVAKLPTDKNCNFVLYPILGSSTFRNITINYWLENEHNISVTESLTLTKDLTNYTLDRTEIRRVPDLESIRIAANKTPEGFRLHDDTPSPTIIERSVDTVDFYYIRNPYTVTYDLNGGTSTPLIPSQTVRYNVETTITNHKDITKIDPTKDPYIRKIGYTFINWAGGNDGPYEPEAKAKFTTDTTLLAQYEINKSTIKIDTNGGNIGEEDDKVPTEIEGEYNSTTIVPRPTRDGYTFDGWIIKTTKDGNDVTQNGELTTENDIDTWTFGPEDKTVTTFTAKWKIITYTITYELPDLSGKLNVEDLNYFSDVYKQYIWTAITDSSSTTISGPRVTYTVEDAFYLDIPKCGTQYTDYYDYVFREWLIADEDGNLIPIDRIEKGTTGDIIVKSRFSILKLEIVPDDTKYILASDYNLSNIDIHKLATGNDLTAEETELRNKIMSMLLKNVTASYSYYKTELDASGNYVIETNAEGNPDTGDITDRIKIGNFEEILEKIKNAEVNITHDIKYVVEKDEKTEEQYGKLIIRNNKLGNETLGYIRYISPNILIGNYVLTFIDTLASNSIWNADLDASSKLQNAMTVDPSATNGYELIYDKTFTY